MSGEQYADLVRQVSALRHADAGEAAGRQHTAHAVQADIDRLTTRLAAQRAHLTQLAQQIKLPAPRFDLPPPSGVSDPAEAAHRAERAITAADVAAQDAHHLAGRPVILPGLSPAARAAAIYAGCAGIGWLAQCGLFLASSETDFGVLAWSLCGLPALAFFAGWLTVATLGQPRTIGGQLPHHVRLGGLICFLGMPIAWIGLIAIFSIL